METTSYKGTNKMLIGIVFGVISFWLFAQSVVNVVPTVQKDLGISLGTLNIAISLTALFSGLFIVAAGGLADKIGRKKMTYFGLILSVIGSLCLVLAQGSVLLIIGRICHFERYFAHILNTILHEMKYKNLSSCKR